MNRSIEAGGRPGDQRGFLHKKIFKGISTIAGLGGLIGIPGASAVSRTFGGFAGRRLPPITIAGGPPPPRSFGRRPRRPPPVSVIPQTFGPTRTPTTFPGQPLNIHRALPVGGGGGGGGDGTAPCPPRLRRNDQGLCVFPGSPFGAQEFGGDVIAGQYGAGFVAGSRIVDVAQCPRGTVLGKDGICYANLANKNRLYPRGRRPLLTGGDMKAIGRARTAGNRLANAKSDLIAIGMLKAAGPRKRRKKASTPC